VLHGEKDQLCSKDSIIELLNSCSSEEINLKVFKEGFHNLHLGKDKASLHACVLNWIKSNVNSSSPLGFVNNVPNKKSNSKRNMSILKIVLLIGLYFKGLQMLLN